MNSTELNSPDLTPLVARLNVVLRRTLKGETLAKCDRCENPETTLSSCVRCNGTGWVTTIDVPAVLPHPLEVPVSPEVYMGLWRALRAQGKGPLATYGFFDMKIQPYDGMYSNPYPLGEPYEVRIIKSNYHQQQRDDAVTFAACERAYLEPPF